MRKETLDRMKALARPAIAVVATVAPTKSWFGGLPLASSSLEWPADSGVPLSFIGQIYLPDLPAGSFPLRLPKNGYLLFFADDGLVGKVYFEPDETKLVELQAPYVEPPKVKGLRKLFGLPPKKQYGPVYNRVNVEFKVIATYPDPDSIMMKALHPNLDLGIDPEDDGELEELSELSSSVHDGNPTHQIFGFAEPVQNDDMELECAAEAKGLDLRYQENDLAPDQKHLIADAAKWRLLLQVDSDDEVGMMWGDAGKLYFWIHEDDAEQLAFDRVSLLAQCG